MAWGQLRNLSVSVSSSINRDNNTILRDFPGGPVVKTLHFRDFPGGPVVKNLRLNARYTSLIPGQGAKIPSCCVA